jgi:hypothetical protein
MPQQAGTARMLKTAEPTIVPTPMSPSVMKVPIALTKSSGADVAAAMKVAPATSFDIERASPGRGGGRQEETVIIPGPRFSLALFGTVLPNPSRKPLPPTRPTSHSVGTHRITASDKRIYELSRPFRAGTFQCEDL